MSTSMRCARVFTLAFARIVNFGIVGSLFIFYRGTKMVAAAAVVVVSASHTTDHISYMHCQPSRSTIANEYIDISIQRATFLFIYLFYQTVSFSSFFPSSSFNLVSWYSFQHLSVAFVTHNDQIDLRNVNVSRPGFWKIYQNRKKTIKTTNK